MVLGTRFARPAGIAAGYLADLVLADPRRGHPVAGFGRAAGALEHLTYRDSRVAGALHTGVLVAGLIAAGAAAGGVGRTRRVGAAVTAAATWVALGGTTLAATGARMADLLDDGDRFTCRPCESGGVQGGM